MPANENYTAGGYVNDFAKFNEKITAQNPQYKQIHCLFPFPYRRTRIPMKNEWQQTLTFTLKDLQAN